MLNKRVELRAADAVQKDRIMNAASGLEGKALSVDIKRNNDRVTQTDSSSVSDRSHHITQ